MTKNKRLAALRDSVKEQNENVDIVEAPKKAFTRVSDEQSNQLDAQVKLNETVKEWQKKDIDIKKVLELQGIAELISSRKILSPTGQCYEVNTIKLSPEQLGLCCISEANVRRFDEDHQQTEVKDLLPDIEQDSQITPIIAYRDGEKFVVIDGKRRLTAAKIAEVSLYADVIDREPSEPDREWLVAASDTRRAFNMIERGWLYTQLIEANGWTQKELCKQRHYDESDVSLCLSLVQSPSGIINALPDKNLTRSQARAIVSTTKKLAKKGVLSSAVQTASKSIKKLSNPTNNDIVSEYKKLVKREEKKESTELKVKAVKSGSRNTLILENVDDVLKEKLIAFLETQKGQP